MPRVGIVTDSTCCLPDELIREYGIRMVPMGLVFEGKVYRDRFDISPDEFWDIFPRLKELPGTCTPTPADFQKVFSELARETDAIVCILVSAALSATAEMAHQGRDLTLTASPQLDIQLVDSKTSAGALGFVVLEAARGAAAGKPVSEVVKVAHEVTGGVKLIATLDTMKYLVHSGRAPRAALIGDVLGVKPILGMVSGSGAVEVLGRARGKQKCLLRMVAIAKRYIQPGRPLHVICHYTDNISDAERLRQIISHEYNCAEMLLAPYSPTMSSGVGPQAAFAFHQS